MENSMKRKKYYQRFLAFIAAVLLILSACQSQSQTDITETEEETEMGFAILENGQAAYGLEADEKSAMLNRDEIEYLKKAFLAVYGTELDGDARHIRVDLQGEKLSWSIALDEATGDIAVRGGSEEALETALHALAGMLYSGAGKPRETLDASVNIRYDSATDAVDNSALLSYISSEEVNLVPGNSSGTLETPEWIESLVMVELRVDMASIGGTMPESKPLLDFYASVGVNALWLCPIYLREGGNGYGNVGAHKFEPAVTGTDDQAQAVRNIREFVDYAHSKGIYIFLDVITWGVIHGSELEKEHPDWFEGEAWGGAAFNWGKKALREWFIETVVNNVLNTDADGLRCDCEPFTSGYDIYGQIREHLAEKGKYIVIMSEAGSDRSRTYDIEQDGVLKYSAMTRGEYYQKPVNFFADGLLDPVDSVKNGTGLGDEFSQTRDSLRGTGKYYTNCITNHDFEARNVCGNRLKIGYAAILAPFIPVWYMGDEFNANCADGVQYFRKINYAEAERAENYYFFEDVKSYIRIRRTYPELFETWAENHRNSNICAVKVQGGAKVGAYARYAADKAALIIPADYTSAAVQSVTVPFADCGLELSAEYRVTDLMTGKEIARGIGTELQSLRAAVRPLCVGVYLVEKIG